MARSAGLITRSCELLYADDNTDAHDTLHMLARRIEADGNFALIFSGEQAVRFLSADLQNIFVDSAARCTGLVCYRCSPSQKAIVVEGVQRAQRVCTLAIGDGGNDVSMIRAASIGVGILGHEGHQAVR